MGPIGWWRYRKKEKSSALQLDGAECLSHQRSTNSIPPYCPYLNPVELLFHDLKDHYIRPSFHQDGSPLQFEEVERIVRNYCDNIASNVLPGFFKARANGTQMRELGMLDL